MDRTTRLNVDWSVGLDNETTTGATVSRSIGDRGRLLAPNQRQRSDATSAQPFADSRPDLIGERDRATSSMPASIQAFWSDLASAGLSPETFAKLIRIAQKPAGWAGPGTRAMRSGSLRAFLDLWNQVRAVAVAPELGLTPDGSLQADWFKSDRQRLDLTFAEPKVLFGLFTSKGILEGAEAPQVVALILRSHPSEPLKWKAG